MLRKDCPVDVFAAAVPCSDRGAIGPGPRFAWAHSAWACCLAAMLAVAVSGCAAGNSQMMKGQLQQAQQQQAALAKQTQELQSRAMALDKDNQEKDILLAQERQRAQVAEDQLTAVREQLRTTATQVARLQEEQKAADIKVQALNASLQRRGGVTIQPNSSYQQELATISLPGIEVRRDGDVIRIELPGEKLYPNADGRLSPEGSKLVTTVAAELVRTYPGHRIGVEGHTNKDPLRPGLWQSHHHMSVTEAMGVYNLLVTQTQLKPTQLVVAGHGANYPVVSNATPAGRQRNHRIELVIYPDRPGQ